MVFDNSRLTFAPLRSRKVLAASIAIISSLLLTACGNTVTEAGKVGDTVITTNDVATSVNEVLAARRGVDVSQMQLQTGSTLVESQFQSYFYSALFDEVAKELKLNITNTELATYKATVIKTVGGDANLPLALLQSNIAKEDFDRTLRQNFIVNQLSTIAKAQNLPNTNGEAITAWVLMAAQKAGVSINPRYGTFNPQTGAITLPSGAAAVEKPATSVAPATK
jgi:urease gamma subunit